MAHSPIDIDVIVQSGDWPEINPVLAIEAVMSVVDDPRAGELSIALTDDAQIQLLNREYRHKDKPTNVLSFPQSGPLLGDIVLAYETVSSEANEKRIRFDDHVTHLLIHGFLHLQGYDHETEAEAATMEALEIEALQRLKIDNPYQIKDA